MFLKRHNKRSTRVRVSPRVHPPSPAAEDEWPGVSLRDGERANGFEAAAVRGVWSLLFVYLSSAVTGAAACQDGFMLGMFACMCLQCLLGALCTFVFLCQSRSVSVTPVLTAQTCVFGFMNLWTLKI